MITLNNNAKRCKQMANKWQTNGKEKLINQSINQFKFVVNYHRRYHNH